MEDADSGALRILIPVYGDWDSLRILIEKLDEQLSTHALRARLLIVDDGSPEQRRDLVRGSLAAIDEIRILTLHRNLGHQRAIAVGLAYVQDHLPCQAVVVMDADGEDDPADVPRLVAKCIDEGGTRIVFARRGRRSEGVRFVFFYVLFKTAYRLLTGMDMRVGNFSVIPFSILQRLVVVSEIWNHYVSGTMKARLPWTTIETARAKRLAGRTQMNFVALATHGLSAIAVNGDVLGVRMLIATSALVVLAIVTMLTAVVIRFTTDLAIPGWATSVVAFSGLAIMQAIALSFSFIFLILGARTQLSTIPKRDYSYFVAGCEPIELPT
jgi:polyisoprenyl-phosphate glycosyltransferase